MARSHPYGTLPLPPLVTATLPIPSPFFDGQLLAVSTREEYGVPQEGVTATLSRLSAPALGVFRAERANACGVSRTQLARLVEQGVIQRVHPSTYRMTVVSSSAAQELQAALLWAGETAAAAGRSAHSTHISDDSGSVVGPESVPCGRCWVISTRCIPPARRAR